MPFLLVAMLSIYPMDWGTFRQLLIRPVELKNLDSNNSFDEWGKLTIGMVYKWTSSNI